MLFSLIIQCLQLVSSCSLAGHPSRTDPPLRCCVSHVWRWKFESGTSKVFLPRRRGQATLLNMSFEEARFWNLKVGSEFALTADLGLGDTFSGVNCL